MKNIIAIDIVIFPPKEIWDLSIFLSEEINKGVENPAVVLDETHFPHITLAQAYINYDEMEKFFNATEEIIQDFRPLPLVTQEVVMEDGWVSFKIRKIKELERLHEALMDSIKEYEQEENFNAFYLDQGEETNSFTLAWVKNFRQNASHENYFPHITLGKNKMPQQIEPRKFTADRIAICQLGNYCTCRKIVKEWKLS